jgi:hypothetical protein
MQRDTATFFDTDLPALLSWRFDAEDARRVNCPASLAAAAWLYLGVVAVFLLPHHTASWSVLGGLLGIAVGLVLGTAAAVGNAGRSEHAPAAVGQQRLCDQSSEQP